MNGATTTNTILSLRDIEELAQHAIAEHGLAAQGWTFAWDRAQKRAGVCKFRTRTIGLSRVVFAIEANREDVLDTILHEVAHALAGHAAGHGPAWQMVARAIGARPERCVVLAEAPTGSIKGSCGCGSIHTMTRMPKRSYSCRICRCTVTWARG